MADIFDVVADATRRDILRVLHERSEAGDAESSVSQLVATLELSQPTVSKHLKVLRESGLVTVREEGQRRYYRIEPRPLEAVEDWLLPLTAAIKAPEEEADAVVGLSSDARDFAGAVGRAFADTIDRVRPRRRR